MRKILPLFMLLCLVVCCGKPPKADPYFLWSPAGGAFDTIMRQIEKAYAHNASADSIFSLTQQLTELAKADTASHLKAARAALFRARYCDRFSPYSEAWKSDAAKEIANAYHAYGDTISKALKKSAGGRYCRFFCRSHMGTLNFQ